MYRLFVLAGLSLVICACSQPPDYLRTVRDFQRYKNEGDLDAALELFVDEPSLHFGALGTIKGRAGVKGILEYDLALNTRLRLEGCETEGREVTCRVTESNDWLRLSGIDSIEYDENRFSLSPDNHIDSITATMSDDSAQKLGTVLAEFHAWATANRPLEYGDLFSADGSFVYSRENAEKVMALLRIWSSE